MDPHKQLINLSKYFKPNFVCFGSFLSQALHIPPPPPPLPASAFGKNFKLLSEDSKSH